MTRTIGYTPKQAKRLKHSLDAECAKIEDAAERLRHTVPDVDPDRFTDGWGGIDGMLEEFRNVATELSGVIDRRTRRSS